MPDIKVLRVEVNHSDKYGDKKVLHLDDGSKWNVSEKKPFYNSISGPGTYVAEFKEFQGKPYISYLKLKAALDGQNQARTNVSTGSGTSTAAANYEANLKLRLEADKKRQDDIRLEFYCGVAKDILIANKPEGISTIDYHDVIGMGVELYKMHLDALDMLQAQSEGKTQPVSNTGVTYQKAKEELEKAKAAEEEPPF